MAANLVAAAAASLLVDRLRLVDRIPLPPPPRRRGRPAVCPDRLFREPVVISTSR